MRIGSGVWAVALLATCLACDRATPRARVDSSAVGSLPTDSVLADSAATDNGEPIAPQRVPDVSVLDSIVLPTNGRDVQIVDDLMYFVESNREGRRSLLGDIFKETA